MSKLANAAAETSPQGESGIVLQSLDLFAGAGGFSLGLEEAGFTSLGAVERDPVAARTLELNFGARPLDFHGRDNGDVTKLADDLLLSRRTGQEAGELDVLVASPPCQGFSRVGRGKLDSMAADRGSFANDQRNQLYKEAIRILCALRPRLFVFENVAGILHLRGRNVAEDVCDAVADAGYVARCTVLNAAWYGVPQIRERVIIIGARQDLGIEPAFPERLCHVDLSRGHLSGLKLNRRNWRRPEFFVDPRTIPVVSPASNAVTVAEALDDLPPFVGHLEAIAKGGQYRPLREKFQEVKYRHDLPNSYCAKMRCWSPQLESRGVSDHFCRWTPRDFETFSLMKPGGRYPAALRIAEERYEEAVRKALSRGRNVPPREAFVPPYPADTFPDKWRKLKPDAPSWTLTAHLGKDTYSHIHYDSAQARALTIREAARLQSFPDAFRFAGNMGDVFRQIGNAVPPLMARAIGGALRSVLENPRLQRVSK